MLTSNRIHSYFDPWKVWHQLHNELNDLWTPGSITPEMPLNVWKKEDQAILDVELPGRRLEDIDVSVHRDVVTVELGAGDRDMPENGTPVREERRLAPLSRHVRLPFEIDTERVGATYDRGMLRVELHRLASTLPSKVTVKAG